jgi:hypothetical protein
MGKALYIESVEHAAAIAGGYERLAAELGVSTGEVESWSAGTAIPESAVFLRLIELLLNPAASRDPESLI